jgi:hypothetical protein
LIGVAANPLARATVQQRAIKPLVEVSTYSENFQQCLRNGE